MAPDGTTFFDFARRAYDAGGWGGLIGFFAGIWLADPVRKLDTDVAPLSPPESYWKIRGFPRTDSFADILMPVLLWAVVGAFVGFGLVALARRLRGTAEG